MSLLDKFETVTVQADNRISAEDKEFCEKHQAAYDAAIQSFQELMFFWEDMEKTQNELLMGTGGTASDYKRYLTSGRGLEISVDAIRNHIKSMHAELIQVIVHHFNRTYNVSVSTGNIRSNLLPKEPDFRRCDDEAAHEEYQKQMLAYRVRYQDVIDQIILLLDGRSFAEQAFYELTEMCHKAAWNLYRKEPEFERKKSTIRFTGYMCNVSDTWRQDQWELEDNMKHIMRGLAYFETGVHKLYPLGFSDLIGFGRVVDNEHEFPTCQKVKSLKMFKSHRVDVKFVDEASAEEFIDQYLGAVC